MGFVNSIRQNVHNSVHVYQNNVLVPSISEPDILTGSVQEHNQATPLIPETMDAHQGSITALSCRDLAT